MTINKNLNKFILYFTLTLLIISIENCYNEYDPKYIDVNNKVITNEEFYFLDGINITTNQIYNSLIKYIPEWANYITGFNYNKLKNDNIVNLDTINLNLIEYYTKYLNINISEKIDYILCNFDDIIFDYNTSYIFILKGNFEKSLNDKILSKIKNNEYNLNFSKFEENIIFIDKSQNIQFSLIDNQTFILGKSNIFIDYLKYIINKDIQLNIENSIALKFTKLIENSNLWIFYKITEKIQNFLIDNDLKVLSKEIKYVLYNSTDLSKTNNYKIFNLEFYCRSKKGSFILHKFLLDKIQKLLKIYENRTKIKELLSVLKLNRLDKTIEINIKTDSDYLLEIWKALK